MKKLLVASTALVAFAAVNSAQAADPIKIAVGGYMNQYVGYTNQDDDGGENFAEVNINSETELYFRGSTKLDNGLTVGVNIDRYSDRNDTQGDDVFMQISSDSLGKLRIGQTKGAAYALSHTAPNVALGNNDGDVQDWISRPGNVTSDQTMTASESNDGQKLVYWTPNLGGFQAGVSYGVNTNNIVIEGPIDTELTAADTAADIGVAYNGDFGGVSFGADVTYQRNFAGGTTGTTVQDRKSVRGGVSVGVAGFTIGGSYRDTSNEASIKNLDSDGWDVGVSYATGPYAVSLSYMEMSEDNTAGSSQEDKNKSWVLGGTYDLGAGVTLIGSVFGAKYDNATVSGNTTSDNDGFGVVTGLKVSF